MGRLEGKVAIITGAGQGIGLAYAERFLAEGAKVVVAEVVEERAAGAMKELEGKGESIFVKTDISDPDSAQHCVDETVKAFGTVHILVNNAALYYDIDNFDPSYEYLQRVTSVNQHGAWLMTRAAAPVMAKQHYGRVINQSSGAAYAYMFPAFGDEFTGLGNYSYSITKWGIVGLTKFMAAQLGELEHHRQLHRAGRHDDRSDEEDRPRHVHLGHDRDDGDEEHARARRPRRRVRVLRERRRQVRDRPDPGDRRRPRHARLKRRRRVGQTRARISPWRTANQASGCSAQRLHDAAISCISSAVAIPSSTACVAMDESVTRSAQRPPHHAVFRRRVAPRRRARLDVRETRGRGPREQERARVGFAAVGAGDGVVHREPLVEGRVAGEPGHRRVNAVARRDHTAGPAHASHLAERANRIGQVLQHLVRVHDVERVGLEVERVRRRSGTRHCRSPVEPLASRRLDRRRCGVDADHPRRRELPARSMVIVPGPQPTSRTVRPGTIWGRRYAAEFSTVRQRCDRSTAS